VDCRSYLSTDVDLDVVITRPNPEVQVWTAPSGVSVAAVDLARQRSVVSRPVTVNTGANRGRPCSLLRMARPNKRVCHRGLANRQAQMMPEEISQR